MKLSLRFFAVLLGGSLAVGFVAANSRAEDSLVCQKSAAFLAPADAPDYRKYAPDREVRLLHLELEVTPDFKQRTISGKATLRLKAAVRPVRELKLDAVDLKVRSLTATEKIQAWHVTSEHIIVTFAAPIAADQEVTVTIAYSAEPAAGLYFRTTEMGYKKGDDHLFTQGEATRPAIGIRRSIRLTSSSRRRWCAMFPAA